jgi:hypothetical protein
MNIQEIEAALLNDYRDKFYANIEKADNDCWIWKGGNERLFTLPGHRSRHRRILARRLAFIFEFGALDEHEHLFSICQTEGCVNPHHLTHSRPLQPPKSPKALPPHLQRRLSASASAAQSQTHQNKVRIRR